RPRTANRRRSVATHCDWVLAKFLSPALPTRSALGAPLHRGRAESWSGHVPRPRRRARRTRSRRVLRGVLAVLEPLDRRGDRARAELAPPALRGARPERDPGSDRVEHTGRSRLDDHLLRLPGRALPRAAARAAPQVQRVDPEQLLDLQQDRGLLPHVGAVLP